MKIQKAGFVVADMISFSSTPGMVDPVGRAKIGKNNYRNVAIRQTLDSKR